jgi:hypothetical protein
MTTYYTDTPSLEERALGADLIIVGRVASVHDQRSEHYGHEVFERTTYSVWVEAVIKGDIRLERVRVEAPGEAVLREGDQLVFMLAEDKGKAHQPDLFVPYFGSAYALGPDGMVEMRSPLPQPTVIRAVPPEFEKISLDEFRRLVHHVVETRAQREQEAIEAERPDERTEDTEYPQEMPLGNFGGGTPSEVQVDRDPKGRLEE